MEVSKTDCRFDLLIIKHTIMNTTLLEIMGKHFLLHESTNKDIINDRNVCELLEGATSVDEWNRTISAIHSIELRADIEQSGLIHQILPKS